MKPHSPSPAISIAAIVPVKQFASAKGRLDGLNAGARQMLAQRMAEITISALQGAYAIGHAFIVSCEPAMAAYADHPNVSLVPDPGQGLNAAFEAGIEMAKLAGFSHSLLIHADLPAITIADVDALIADWMKGSIDRTALSACKEGAGTNAVLIPLASGFAPQFGEGSFARHQAQAGATAHIIHAPAIALDVDRIDDLDLSPALLSRAAASMRDDGHGTLITYAPKVFLPVTQLCRDVCHYCTFAKAPRALKSPYMAVEEAVRIAKEGALIGCKEALLTLGDRPEARYAAARDWLDANGFASTLDYVAHVAQSVRDETGLLPHISAGVMNAEEMAMLRPVSASMGLMLESASDRLCKKGGPHFGSPDKAPALRLATIAEAGKQAIPFTTGLLVGIGETRAERIEALAAIKALHNQYGHIQELIIQNFLPKQGTKMADHPPALLAELVWTIAMARLMFGPDMSIQAPPNLNKGALADLIAAGINDWGGVSPLTPDHVNPEAPWPEIATLAEATANAGKTLVPRLTIYPSYAQDAARWLDPAMRPKVLALADGAALAREDGWVSGRSQHAPPKFAVQGSGKPSAGTKRIVRTILDSGADMASDAEISALFNARGPDFHMVCEAADALRTQANGDDATFVINRNINYTNICTFACNFCAFSKGTRKHEGAEKPYLLSMEEIARRTVEARERGATEVCLQGGIHPTFTGKTYLQVLETVKNAVPDMHVHAFSPLEISHGAASLGMNLRDYLTLLQDHGLGSLPGTAAEILDDTVRAQICPDKLNTNEWLEVIETAHEVGLRTTATIMFGHVDSYASWASHLRQLRQLQVRTMGLTEFVPLAFVAHEAPLFKRGQARRGPTLRESILMHAVSRLMLDRLVPNIQASWVKLGREGMKLALQSGANDLGGTLMDESITRAAGAQHGQEMSVADLTEIAGNLGRPLVQRTTLYQPVRAKELA